MGPPVQITDNCREPIMKKRRKERRRDEIITFLTVQSKPTAKVCFARWCCENSWLLNTCCTSLQSQSVNQLLHSDVSFWGHFINLTYGQNSLLQSLIPPGQLDCLVQLLFQLTSGDNPTLGQAWHQNRHNQHHQQPQLHVNNVYWK